MCVAILWRIALVVETGSAYGRSVLRGAKRFAESLGGAEGQEAGEGVNTHSGGGGDSGGDSEGGGDSGGGGGGWLLEVIQPHEASAAVLDPNRFAGAIVRLPVEALGEVERSGVPVVMLYELPAGSRLRRVGMDNEAVGRAAAAYLRELTPASYGFFGAESAFAATRRRAFADWASIGREDGDEDGDALTRCGAEAGEAEVVSWLRGLPKPAAVLAGNDEAGLRLTNLCRSAGVGVPEDVAILGVDNDELLCELCEPPLSSIVLPAERVGYEAAALLRRLLAGDADAPGSVLLPPGEVVARRSTERLPSADPLVREALGYLRDHATEPIDVEDLLGVLSCSRRHMEQSMKRAIGRTPGQELTRLRIARAKALLSSGELPLEEVATRSGYRNGVRLSVAFRREVGLTPGRFRRRQRERLFPGYAPHDATEPRTE